MGSEELLGRIRADGRAKVAEVRAERDRQVGEIEARFGAEAGRLEQEFRARIEQETKQALERARSRARLDARKELLAARWQVIEDVFGQARARVLSDPEYPALLKALAAKHRGKDGRVRLSAADVKRLGKGLNAETDRDIDGGLRVEFGRQVLDFSLGESLGAIRDELAPRLAEKLFPQPGT
jgi:vacuolar-type H+-ATPase subunit E/Vma4